MRGTWRIDKLRRKARRLFVRGAVVLTYHRVADLSHDPYQLAVSPAHFAAHINYLKRTCTIMPLVQLGKALKNKDLPRRPVAVTFDDGCLDLLEQAYPIIRAARVPVTVFVPSGLVGQQRELWWDELERIFYYSEELRPDLKLRVQNRDYHWDIRSCGTKAAFWDVYKIIKSLSYDERVQALNQLAKWSGRETACRAGYRPMDADELRRIVSDGWIEVGAHTITHAALSSLDEAEQRKEVFGGRDALSGLLDRSIPAFAYPYGCMEDFTDQAVAILREAGFEMACTMIKGSLEPGVDLLRSNRCAVNNWPVDVFARELESFFIS